MQEQTLDGHLGRPVAIDLCPSVPVVLVRRAREPEPDAGVHAGALPRHRRARRRGRRRHGPDLAKCPRCRAPAAAHARHAADDAVRVPEVPQRSWPADDVLRLPAREGLHPPAHAAADRRAAAERADGQLLELRRARRSGNRRGLRALRLAAVDARHEAGRSAGRAAAEGRSTRRGSRSIRRCRCDLARARARWRRRSAACRARRRWFRRRVVVRAWSAPA